MASTAISKPRRTQHQVQYVLFETWQDVAPRMLGVFEGTVAEFRAFIAGWNLAIDNSGGGELASLETILSEPAMHGLEQTSGPLLFSGRNRLHC
jgi:hypothetical protein